MNIFFDARWTRTDVHDGVSRYGASLVAALAEMHPVTVLVHDPAQLRMLPENVEHIIVNHPISPRELLLARKLNTLGADVVFTPLQVIGFHGRKYKLILTLQDLIYYRHPQPPTFLPWHIRTVWRAFHMTYWPQRLLLNRADHVATVSETSKRYIEENRLTKRDVTAVRNAPIQTPAIPPGKTKKDLIYMGSFMPYKNVEALIRGMADIPDYTLHLLSKISPARKTELQKLVPKKSHVVFHNGVSDEQYHKLLSTATALVTASKEEGFGLPLVEAMNVSIPVICSDIEIFHEVAGEAGIFFHPDKSKEFAAQVKQLEKPAIRKQAIQKGKAQAAQFSWEASAETLLGVMQDLHTQKS